MLVGEATKAARLLVAMPSVMRSQSAETVARPNHVETAFVREAWTTTGS